MGNVSASFEKLCLVVSSVFQISMISKQELQSQALCILMLAFTFHAKYIPGLNALKNIGIERKNI